MALLESARAILDLLEVVVAVRITAVHVILAAGEIYFGFGLASIFGSLVSFLLGLYEVRIDISFQCF